MKDAMQSQWVTGRFSGDRAKSVLAHADEGIGYIILDSTNSRGASLEVVAAFRRSDNDAVPEHLERVTDPLKIRKYEKIRIGRHGIETKGKLQ